MRLLRTGRLKVLALMVSTLFLPSSQMNGILQPASNAFPPAPAQPLVFQPEPREPMPNYVAVKPYVQGEDPVQKAVLSGPVYTKVAVTPAKPLSSAIVTTSTPVKVMAPGFAKQPMVYRTTVPAASPGTATRPFNPLTWLLLLSGLSAGGYALYKHWPTLETWLNKRFSFSSNETKHLEGKTRHHTPSESKTTEEGVSVTTEDEDLSRFDINLEKSETSIRKRTETHRTTDSNSDSGLGLAGLFVGCSTAAFGIGLAGIYPVNAIIDQLPRDLQTKPILCHIQNFVEKSKEPLLGNYTESSRRWWGCVASDAEDGVRNSSSTPSPKSLASVQAFLNDPLLITESSNQPYKIDAQKDRGSCHTPICIQLFTKSFAE
jgi:hypothetical protein